MNKYQQARLTAALDYASRGWRVLPIKASSKTPLNHNGSKGATTDKKQIVDWWTNSNHDFANVGVACGKESFFVIDIDMKNNVDGLNSLTQHFGDKIGFDFKTYLSQKTPSGGVHLLFQYPDNAETISNSVGILPGVDIRGDGGYIVVAPSAIRNKEGNFIMYRWNDGSLPVSPIQDWALDLLMLQKEKQSTGPKVNVANALYKGFAQGSRDMEIYRLCCSCLAQGYSKEITQAIILSVSDKCNPPFDHGMALEKLEYAYRYMSKSKKE